MTGLKNFFVLSYTVLGSIALIVAAYSSIQRGISWGVILTALNVFLGSMMLEMIRIRRRRRVLQD